MAAAVTLAGTTGMIPRGDVETVASVASLRTLTALVAIHACLIVPRRHEPDPERPFRVPWSIHGYPVSTFLAIGISIALVTHFEPVVYAIACGAFAFAGLVYVVWARRLPSKPHDE